MSCCVQVPEPCVSAVLNVCCLCVSTCYTRVGWWWGGPRLQCRAESSRRREIGLEQTHYGKQLPGRGSRPAGPAARRLGGSSMACKNVWVSNPRKGLPGTGRLRGAAAGQQPLLLTTPHCLSSLPPPPWNRSGCGRKSWPLALGRGCLLCHLPRCLPSSLTSLLPPPVPAPARTPFAFTSLPPAFELIIHTLVSQIRWKTH